MFKNLFKRDKTLLTKTNLQRLQEKVSDTTHNFDKRLIEIGDLANSLYKTSEKASNEIYKFKRFCHSMDYLISDKDKDLKLIFANHLTCNFLYGLPTICSDLITGRYEYSIINDYIEKTKNWNSFIECENFNIDEIVKEQLEQKEFLQVGYIDKAKLILKTTLKPHIEDNKFDGIITVSTIIDENVFEKMLVNSKMLHDDNDYKVWEI